MSLFVPDAVALFPIAWWLIFALRASNFRTYLASAIGVLLVVLYFGIAWLLWPQSTAIQFILHAWETCFPRVFVVSTWAVSTTAMRIALVTSAVFACVGLICIIGFGSRFTQANVRIQSRSMIAAFAFLIAAVSAVSPPAQGLSLFPIVWLAAIYMTSLYLLTYGFPHFSFRMRSKGSSVRRLSRKADSHNPFKRKPSTYGSPRRSFSRSSRGRSHYSS